MGGIFHNCPCSQTFLYPHWSIVSRKLWGGQKGTSSIHHQFFSFLRVRTCTVPSYGGCTLLGLWSDCPLSHAYQNPFWGASSSSQQAHSHFQFLQPPPLFLYRFGKGSLQAPLQPVDSQVILHHLFAGLAEVDQVLTNRVRKAIWTGRLVASQACYL